MFLLLFFFKFYRYSFFFKIVKLSKKIFRFLFFFHSNLKEKKRRKILEINRAIYLYFRFEKEKKKEEHGREIRVISHEGEIKNASDGILALGSGSLTPTSDEPTSKNRRPDVKLYSEPDAGAVHRLPNRRHRNSTGGGGEAAKWPG